MKVPAYFSQFTDGFARLAWGCIRLPGRIGSLLFGDISWRPPGWATKISGAWRGLQRSYPRLVGLGIVCLFLLACGTAWAWRWYQDRPKPHKVCAKISPIPVTPLDKKLVFPPLKVRFSESAARLEDIHKTPLPGVRLEPAISGFWFWDSDAELTFYPREDWPADQKFRIIFDKKFFPSHVLMDRLVYDISTPPFAIKVRQLQFYQDPINQGQRQVTVTFELTHAISPGELDRHIQLSMIGGSPVFQSADAAPHFVLSYGLHRRLAYLRTSGITLPDREDFMKVTLSKGVRTTQGGAETREGLEQKVRVPSIATMFRIDSIEGVIARDKNDEPQQAIVLKTSTDISTRELGKWIDIWLLPKKKAPAHPKPDTDEERGDADEEEGEANDYYRGRYYYSDEDGPISDDGRSNLKEGERWKSATDVPEEVLAAAKHVEFTPLPSDKAHDQQHTFRVAIEGDGELYLQVRKGVRALGDYPLAENYKAVVPVPLFPREVEIQGKGGLLALNGERKLSIRSRALAGIEYEIARVSTAQINHLVSQTGGQFEHPHFKAPFYFNEENISRIAIEHQPIAIENKWKANYSAFDFSQHLRKPSDGGTERGLFFLTARGWDPVEKKAIPSVRDNRFLLITDIGILAKRNADKSQDLFLISIKTGKPIDGATVELLGKNGVPILTSKTDGQGHCTFSSVEKTTHDQAPIAFVARSGEDVAFIPYARQDRILNFSRFDIDGAESVSPENLDAFLFTERGVYRPGDEIHAALVVKQRNWQGELKGLPLETEVVDARGLSVQTRKVSLPETGFAEFSYQTANESPTGLYTINLYLVKNSKRTTLLGSTTANVKEFLPDRMKIETRLSKSAGHGWVAPDDMHAFVGLANLYGTPATDRRITAKVTLFPSAFRFPEFPDFVFYDPLIEENKDRRAESIDLGELKTDASGRTEFDLKLERFATATYSMRFIAEGFEGEGGRSVTSESGTLVSALPYVVGFKADGALTYIGMKKPRRLDLLAVDPKLNRIAIENLTLNIIAQEYVSVLTRQDNGNYAYESVLKERTTKSERISISANGLRYDLPTDDPGSYVFELRDDQDRRLTKAEFCVIGRGTVAHSLENSSELDVKLDRTQYKSGEEIAISITAPYVGHGLITIERDKVYAYQWFQTKNPGSVQHIVVPPDFEGSGYINVAFVRAIDSKEIFVSPLSYGVAPFTANIEKRRLKIDLETPARSKPGEKLHIAYRADRPCKIVLFAVDQGILQVTDYKTPDPLEFFFRKCALRVQTSQIVDLIIPEFSVLRSLSAFGGGGDIQHLNPFKRVTDKPVVFWSGIVDADTNRREVIYDVPDFFDGNLKIMAVAVSNENTGSAERDALIRGPFVITPSVPVLAAPGDEFEAGVTVANGVEGSGADAEIQLRAESNEYLSIPASSVQTMRISEGHEQSTTFRFRASDKLGSGEIRFIATRNGAETSRHSTLSVRPPVPYVTDVRSGTFKKNSAQVPITRSIHPEFEKRCATISALPLGLAHGIDAYLKNFPYGCSEQITSGAFCRLVLAGEADFGLSRGEINKQLECTFGVLRRRQNDQGGFGYWEPETGDQISFVSAYVMDFLSEAKAGGFAPPAEMFAAGLRNLQRVVAREPKNFSDGRTMAYAIYVLTRENVITTNYILNLIDYLNKHDANEWKSDITGVYLAGALHLLHKDSDAEILIGLYRLDNNESPRCDDFHQPLGMNSEYIAILAREFPARMKKITAEQFEQVLQPMADGQFNTLSAAYSVRALKSYSAAIDRNLPEVSIVEVAADNHETRLVAGAKLLQHSAFSRDAKALQFRSDARVSGPGLFFQVMEAGFDKQVPQESLANGLEVYRELLGRNNQPVTQTSLGEAVRVRLHIRSLQRKPIANVAIVDLLPGGFEIVDSSVHRGLCAISGVDYVDIREDRAVFFATAPVHALEIDYKIKSCNRGDFIVPPVFAESMYERNIKGRGVGGRITVTQ
jgi:alpha-2-macroglobulin